MGYTLICLEVPYDAAFANASCTPSSLGAALHTGQVLAIFTMHCHSVALAATHSWDDSYTFDDGLHDATRATHQQCRVRKRHQSKQCHALLIMKKTKSKPNFQTRTKIPNRNRLHTKQQKQQH
jgi:hypothetical protein